MRGIFYTLMANVQVRACGCPETRGACSRTNVGERLCPYTRGLAIAPPQQSKISKYILQETRHPNAYYVAFIAPGIVVVSRIFPSVAS